MKIKLGNFDITTAQIIRTEIINYNNNCTLTIRKLKNLPCRYNYYSVILNIKKDK